MCKLTSPETTFTLVSFIRLSYTGPLSTCPNHSRTRYQTTKDSTYTPESTEVIKTSQSCACSPSLARSFRRNHNKDLCPCFPPAPSASRPSLVLPHVAPWCSTLTDLGKCDILSIQCQLSPDLLASPYLSNNKTHILKQCF